MLLTAPKVFSFIKNKFSKYVIKKALKYMKPEHIDSIVHQYESKWSTFNSKEQKKLNSLIEKMYSIKHSKPYEVDEEDDF
jgi:hypothetical protein